MRGRLLGCLMLVTLPAWAGSDVCLVLPEGQPVEPWVEPLDMAGLGIAGAGCEATVELDDRDGTWRLRVTDAQGTVHEPADAFEEPRTEEERERLVWLVYSLLHPVEPLTLPVATHDEAALAEVAPEVAPEVDAFEAPLTVSEAEQWVEAMVASLEPEPPAESSPPEPAPRRVEAPGVASLEEERPAEPPASVPAEPPATEVAEAPPPRSEPSRRLRVWARTSAAFVSRGGVADTAEPWLMAGVSPGSGRLLFGLGGGHTARRALDAGGDWYQRSTSLAGAVMWRPGAVDSVLVGLHGGVSDFAFSDGEEVAARKSVPWVALEAGVSGATGLGRLLRLELFGRVQRDFVDIEVSIDGVVGGRLSPWSAQVGLALVVVGERKRDPSGALDPQAR